LTAESLRLPGVGHGFFTRIGGVSRGVYASLNGGVGSRDSHEAVAENRSRAAVALGVAPERLAVPYQIHSADAVAISEPWTPSATAALERFSATASCESRDPTPPFSEA
jgi:copper oxidase (laccase) domain-containing protein